MGCGPSAAAQGQSPESRGKYVTAEGDKEREGRGKGKGVASPDNVNSPSLPTRSKDSRKNSPEVIHPQCATLADVEFLGPLNRGTLSVTAIQRRLRLRIDPKDTVGFLYLLRLLRGELQLSHPPREGGTSVVLETGFLPLSSIVLTPEEVQTAMPPADTTESGLFRKIKGASVAQVLARHVAPSRYHRSTMSYFTSISRPAMAIALSLDDRYLVVCPSKGKTVFCRPTKTDLMAASLSGSGPPRTIAAFPSPCVQDFEFSATQYDFSTGERTGRFKGSSDMLSFKDAVFLHSAADGVVLLAGAEGTLRFFSAGRYRDIKEICLADDVDMGRITCMKRSPDGQYLAVAGHGYMGFLVERGVVALYKTAEVGTVRFTNIGQLIGHTAPCTAVDFHTTDPLVVSGDSAGKIILWDLCTQSPLRALRFHRAVIMSVAFVDSTTFVSCDPTTICCWGVESASEAHPLWTRHGQQDAEAYMHSAEPGQTEEATEEAPSCQSDLVLPYEENNSNDSGDEEPTFPETSFVNLDSDPVLMPHRPRKVVALPGNAILVLMGATVLILNARTGEILDEHCHSSIFSCCAVGRSVVAIADVNGHVFRIDLHMKTTKTTVGP